MRVWLLGTGWPFDLVKVVKVVWGMGGAGLSAAMPFFKANFLDDMVGLGHEETFEGLPNEILGGRDGGDEETGCPEGGRGQEFGCQGGQRKGSPPKYSTQQVIHQQIRYPTDKAENNHRGRIYIPGTTINSKTMRHQTFPAT